MNKKKDDKDKDLKGIVVRIYPNEKQIAIIEQCIGNARFVWNQFLNVANERYKNNPSLPPLRRSQFSSLLPTMKNEHNYPFLNKGEATSLQAVAMHLDEAFDDFFSGTKGYPRFKSKRNSKASYTIVASRKSVELQKTKIKLTRLGWMPARWSSDIPFKKIQRVTITRHPTGEYTASVLVRNENQALPKTGKVIGLDMGQTDLMVASNGDVVKTKKYHTYEAKLKDWQRKASRRARLAKERRVPLVDAKNYQRAKQMVAKYHAKIRNCRMDYLHKETIRLVRSYDVIAVEDLKVKQIMDIPNPTGTRYDKRKNNHAIANQSWGTIQVLLKYKCEWYGKSFVKVDPRYTTQECSSCKARTGPKGDLSVRKWTCIECGVHHDRDVNAAKNILDRGLDILKTPVVV